MSESDRATDRARPAKGTIDVTREKNYHGAHGEEDTVETTDVTDHEHRDKGLRGAQPATVTGRPAEVGGDTQAPRFGKDQAGGGDSASE